MGHREAQGNGEKSVLKYFQSFNVAVILQRGKGPILFSRCCGLKNLGWGQRDLIVGRDKS